jgi:hypothetical protein
MSAPTGNFRGQRTQSSCNGYKTIGSSIASGNNGGAFKRIFINALGNTNGNYDLALTKTLGIPRHYYNSTSNSFYYQQPTLSGQRVPISTDPKALTLTQVYQSATATPSITCALDNTNTNYSDIITISTSNSNVYLLNSNLTLSCPINYVPTGKFLYIPPNVTMTIPSGIELETGTFSTSSGQSETPGYISNNGTISGSGTFSVSIAELINLKNNYIVLYQDGPGPYTVTFNLSGYLSSLDNNNYQYITIFINQSIQLVTTTVIPARVTLQMCEAYGGSTTAVLTLTENITNNGSIQIGCEPWSQQYSSGELNLGNYTLTNNNLIYLYNSGFIDLPGNISGLGLFLSSSTAP